MTIANEEPDLAYALRRLQGILFPPTKISPLPAGIRVEKDVLVPMRDGIRLSVNMYRPETDGQYPVIICAHPYSKDLLPQKTWFGYSPVFSYRMMRQPAPVSFSDQTGWEAPDPATWVPKGYVLINADLRGFFKSQGKGDVISDQEADDYHDLIEWAAKQPWSTGKVGLNGVSYLAISQWKVAALRPPHLAAICPWEGLSDFYKDLGYPGGIREDGFVKLWGAGVKSVTNVREAQLKHPLRDDWSKSLVAELSAITVPALICGSFSDHSLHTRGSFRAFSAISSPHKWLFTHRGGKWATYYSPEAVEVQQRFFDHFLKGLANEQLAVPPVRLAVYDTKDEYTVRHETAWPLPQTQWTPLFLNASKARAGLDMYKIASTVLFDTQTGRATFDYVLPADTELTGPMMLKLFVSVSGAADMNVFAGVRKIRDGQQVVFEGGYGCGYDMVTKGWLKASLRKTNPVISKPYQPDYDFDQPQPLQDGQVVELQIALLPSATLFRKGDVLRVDVRGTWFFKNNPIVGYGPAYYEPSSKATCTLHTGGPYDSQLLMPVIPVQ